MSYAKNLSVCLVMCLVLVFGCSVVLANPHVNIVNKSGAKIYIYDMGGSNPKAAIQLENGQTLNNYQLAVASSKRIWIANAKLATIESGGQPAPFNLQADGDKMFSFFEYTVIGDKYIVNLSVVDYFSYPLTLSFMADQTNVCVKNFEYGFKSFSQAAAALKSQGKTWSQLVLQGEGPNPIYRIYGPNIVWETGLKNGIKSLPTNLQSFYTDLPPDGLQLFAPHTNNDVWQNYAQISGFNVPVESRLMTVGYSKALLSVLQIDKNKKHGIYLFPKDAQAEFTNLLNSNTMTVTVYPYNDKVTKK